MPSDAEGKALRARVEALQADLREQRRERDKADARVAKLERQLAASRDELATSRVDARTHVERAEQRTGAEEARRLGTLESDLVATRSELVLLRVAQAPVERARTGELRVHELRGGLFSSEQDLLTAACEYADGLAPGQLLSVTHYGSELRLWHFGSPAKGALGQWFLDCHSLTVRAFGKRWKTATAESLEFARHVPPSDLVCISQHRDDHGGSLVVWYWKRR